MPELNAAILLLLAVFAGVGLAEFFVIRPYERRKR
jgi:regulator of protease activity HflC (stomatin/prohibitin superfamily)